VYLLSYHIDVNNSNNIVVIIDVSISPSDLNESTKDKSVSIQQNNVYIMCMNKYVSDKDATS